MKNNFSVFIFTTIFTLCSVANASDYDAKLQVLVTKGMHKILSDGIVADSIINQNKKHASLTADEIDKLDKKWRSETKGGGGDLIDRVLSTRLSVYLNEALESKNGLYSEIFVMDNRGLNVGQSGLTSDYWQGDESKWKETYLVGPNASHLSEIEFDESSQTYQIQVSVSIVDKLTGKVIGAATFGVNVEALDYASIDDLG